MVAPRWVLASLSRRPRCAAHTLATSLPLSPLTLTNPHRGRVPCDCACGCGCVRVAVAMWLCGAQNYGEYLSIIDSLPDQDAPELFGLPQNIQRSVQRAQSKHVIKQLKALQVLDAAAAGFDREQWRTQLGPLLEMWSRLTSGSGVRCCARYRGAVGRCCCRCDAAWCVAVAWGWGHRVCTCVCTCVHLCVCICVCVCVRLAVRETHTSTERLRGLAFCFFVFACRLRHWTLVVPMRWPRPRTWPAAHPSRSSWSWSCAWRRGWCRR